MITFFRRTRSLTVQDELPPHTVTQSDLQYQKPVIIVKTPQSELDLNYVRRSQKSLTDKD